MGGEGDQRGVILELERSDTLFWFKQQHDDDDDDKNDDDDNNNIVRPKPRQTLREFQDDLVCRS